MISSKERSIHLIDVDVPIVSSYHREQNLQELRTAALYFKNLGLSTYPDHLQDPIKIDEEFVFFGGDLEIFRNNKRQFEIEFLKAINQAKLVYVVTTNGYLGRSSSIELTYSLFKNAPIALSQSITDFGGDVPSEIKNVIENNKTLFPIIPVNKIRELKTDSLWAFLPSKRQPSLSILSLEDKNAILASIRSLVRHLERSSIT